MADHPSFGEQGWRRFLDPAGAFPSDGLQHLELRAIEVLRALDGRSDEPRGGSLADESLPNEHPPGFGRTRDVIQLDYPYAPDGDPLDFISLVFSAEHLEIRLPGIDWTRGYMGPFTTSRAWRRQAFTRLGGRALARFIAAGIAEQRERFATCVRCGARIAPGHYMTLAGVGAVCHGCASRYLKRTSKAPAKPPEEG